MSTAMDLNERLRALGLLGLEVVQSKFDANQMLPNNRAAWGLAEESQIYEQLKAKMVTAPRSLPTLNNKESTIHHGIAPSYSAPDHDIANNLSTMEFPEYGQLKPKDTAPKEMQFTSWDLFLKYPDWYVGKTNTPIVLPFFTKEKRQAVVWDFFYIYDPKNLQKPILLVPKAQVERFLLLVNASAGLLLTIPAGKPGKRFNLTFDIGYQPRARYLGRSTTLNEFKALTGSIPLFDDYDAIEKATQYGLDNLTEKLNISRLGDDAASKARAAAQRAKERRDKLAGLMLEAQKLLGLTAAEGSSVLDPEQPPLVPPEGSTVLLSVDVELMEGASTVMTEIGLSILDTNDIIGIAPGNTGVNWFPFIKSRHLRVQEYRHFKNHKYVRGCPDKFDFGQSEFPLAKEAVKVVEDVFFEYSDLDREGNQVPGRKLRDVIIVGHDIQSDMQYLNRFGVDVMAAHNFFKTVDTKDLHQHWTRSDNGRTLGYVLNDLQIGHKNLHNAGNDAAYTMRAMLALAVEHAAGGKPSVTPVEDVE